MLTHEGNWVRGRDRERESRCVCPSLIVCIRVHSFGEEGEVERERENLCVSLSVFVCVSVDSFEEQWCI